MDDAQLREEVSTLMRRHLHVIPPDEEADLVAKGLVDSLKLVELFSVLEQQFRIEVVLDEVDLDDFRSVASIAAYVKRQQSAVRGSAEGAG